VIASAALAAALAASPAARDAPGAVEAAGFGKVAIHAPSGPPARVVLLLSGAGGLDPATGDLAAALAAGGALVAAVDTPAYLAARPAGRCAYPAGDLEELAQRVEKLRGLDAYERPALVGHSRGAALAWAALANGPAGTFAGAVAIGPCPDRPLPVRLCAPHGQPPRALPGGALPALAPPPGPFEIVSGAEDATCPPAAAAGLARALGARFTSVAGAGHALSPALGAAALEALARIAPPPAPPAPPAARAAAAPAGAAPIADLPVVEVPAARPGRRLVLLLTGDGGWVGIDKALAAEFAAAGVAVVGLDSLRYFWRRRTPEETARDAARILAHYRTAWGRDEVLLVGYSRGADIVPIVAGRLPPEERARVRLVAMLGPGTFAELEVHAIDLFSARRRASALSTEEAVRATGGAVPMLCVHGSEEHDSLCPLLADLPWVSPLLLTGGHHFDGGYAELARKVLAAAP